ncbi:MAG: DUF4430 domain-containing protein [Oscillospiraceae bacterium]|nr:DUF4430 domain-containing protein [Oscillospiraceae bacterium]
MKNTMKKLFPVLLSMVMVLSLVACSDDTSSQQDAQQNSRTTQTVETGLWAAAIYTEDTEVGEGENIVAVTVSAEEKSIVITLKTDEENFGQALRKSGFVEGSESDYGLYISHVNGIKAIYEEDNAYWAFLDGEGNYMSYGVDEAELTGNDAYQLVYTPA